MTTVDALDLLELEEGASELEVLREYGYLLNEMHILLSNAPTDMQMQLYQSKMEELDTAAEVLLIASEVTEARPFLRLFRSIVLFKK